MFSTSSSAMRTLTLLPEVGLDDALVLAHLLRQTLGDLLAVIEHGDALRHAHHDLHVVLDQEDGEPTLVAELLHERGELRRLLRVHARRRLVEQQHLRVGRERPRYLEPALIAVGEVDRYLLEALLALPDVPEPLARLLVRALLLLA